MTNDEWEEFKKEVKPIKTSGKIKNSSVKSITLQKQEKVSR